MWVCPPVSVPKGRLSGVLVGLSVGLLVDLERRMMGACHGRFLRTGSNTVLDLVVFSSHLWRHVGAGGFGVCWCCPSGGG
jgi:hypothetical protein